MKQKLLKFWFVFWLIMAFFAVGDIVQQNQYQYYVINKISIIITIINFCIFKFKR